jgi:hypothetical protein
VKVLTFIALPLLAPLFLYLCVGFHINTKYMKERRMRYAIATVIASDLRTIHLSGSGELPRSWSELPSLHPDFDHSAFRIASTPAGEPPDSNLPLIIVEQGLPSDGKMLIYSDGTISRDSTVVTQYTAPDKFLDRIWFALDAWRNK